MSRQEKESYEFIIANRDSIIKNLKEENEQLKRQLAIIEDQSTRKEYEWSQALMLLGKKTLFEYTTQNPKLLKSIYIELKSYILSIYQNVNERIQRSSK